MLSHTEIKAFIHTLSYIHITHGLAQTAALLVCSEFLDVKFNVSEVILVLLIQLGKNTTYLLKFLASILHVLPFRLAEFL